MGDDYEIVVADVSREALPLQALQGDETVEVQNQLAAAWTQQAVRQAGVLGVAGALVGDTGDRPGPENPTWEYRARRWSEALALFGLDATEIGLKEGNIASTTTAERLYIDGQPYNYTVSGSVFPQGYQNQLATLSLPSQFGARNPNGTTEDKDILGLARTHEEYRDELVLQLYAEMAQSGGIGESRIARVLLGMMVDRTLAEHSDEQLLTAAKHPDVFNRNYIDPNWRKIIDPDETPLMRVAITYWDAAQPAGGVVRRVQVPNAQYPVLNELDPAVRTRRIFDILRGTKSLDSLVRAHVSDGARLGWLGFKGFVDPQDPVAELLRNQVSVRTQMATLGELATKTMTDTYWRADGVLTAALVAQGIRSA